MVSPISPSAEASSSKAADNIASLGEGILDESPAEQEEVLVLTDEEIKVYNYAKCIICIYADLNQYIAL